MKFHLYKFLLLAFVVVFAAVFPMDAPLSKPEPITEKAFAILELPAELQAKVGTFVMSSNTIEEATKNIRALVQTNSQFRQLLNDEKVTVGLIRFLQQRFNVVDWVAAIALRTVGAGGWLAKHYDSYYARISQAFIDAAVKNNWSLVQFFLENIPGIVGKEKVLLAALEAKNRDIVQLLLNKKANPNVQFIRSLETPLIVAIQEDCPIEIIQLLLNAGANPNIKAKDNLTALSIAVEKDNAAIVKLLLGAGADTESISSNATPLIEAIQHGFTDIVRLLLEAGANANFAPRHGITPLMIAARQGSVEIMELLLTFGANSNARSDLDYTPLIYAIHAKANRIAAVKLLLENGADQMVRNKQGRTALESAESMDPHEDKQRIIELLKNPPPLKKIRKLQ